MLYILKINLSRLMTKLTKWPLCPGKTQISLGIRPVWLESSLSAWRKLGSLATHWVHSEDWSDWADAQPDPSLHWAHESFCHFVGFVMSWLICDHSVSSGPYRVGCEGTTPGWTNVQFAFKEGAFNLHCTSFLYGNIYLLRPKKKIYVGLVALVKNRECRSAWSFYFS